MLTSRCPRSSWTCGCHSHPQANVSQMNAGTCVGLRTLPDPPRERLVLPPSAKNGFVQVMSALLSAFPIGVVASCGKYPLPAPLLSGVGIFAIQSLRQIEQFRLLSRWRLDNFFQRPRRMARQSFYSTKSRETTDRLPPESHSATSMRVASRLNSAEIRREFA